jgi:hypothetical protein
MMRLPSAKRLETKPIHFTRAATGGAAWGDDLQNVLRQSAHRSAAFIEHADFESADHRHRWKKKAPESGASSRWQSTTGSVTRWTAWTAIARG